jgi:leucyl-tRNA synthetase
MIPITPHLANECLNEISDNKIYNWPKIDDKYLNNKFFDIVVQINGKKRALISTKENLNEKN